MLRGLFRPPAGDLYRFMVQHTLRYVLTYLLTHVLINNSRLLNNVSAKI